MVRNLPALDHFEVRVEKDTIAFTETSKIFVQAKDAEGQDIELDGSTLLKFELLGEWAYGTFIKPSGDTLKTTPVELENIRYDDARSGKVQVAAVAANPEVSAQPLVRVSLMDDETKSGEEKIVVVEQRLRIVMGAPLDVQPVIPPATVNAPRAENRKPFTVRLTRAGQPVPNHQFRLTTDYVDGSGGHDHLVPRRTDSRENYGHFILVRTGGHHERPYEGQTQADGQERFDYVASIWGDLMKISVESVVNRLLKDSVTVAERVPGLIGLGPGQHYELVGAPHNHAGTNDPCRHAPPTSQHSRNHFGTAALISAIQNIAASYDSLDPGVRLRINDMSLPLGGLFDFENSWQVPHREHRVGRNADIGFSGIGSNGRCIERLNLQRLSEIIETYTDDDPYTHRGDSPHYHIRVR